MAGGQSESSCLLLPTSTFEQHFTLDNLNLNLNLSLFSHHQRSLACRNKSHTSFSARKYGIV